MKTYLGLIPRNLIKNKKRTLALAVSIMLSIVLITSTEILIKSVVNSSMRDNQMIMGKYHASYMGMPYFSIDKVKQNKKVDRVATTSLIAQCKSGESVIEMYGMDGETIDLLSMKLVDGKYPQKQGEAIVEKWVLNKIKPNAKIGDKISIECSIFKISETDRKSKQIIEFTICGVLENTSIGRDIGVGKIYTSFDEAEKIVDRKDMSYYQYFTVKKDLPIRDTAENLKDEFGTEGMGRYRVNKNYLSVIDMSKNAKEVVFFMDIIIALIASIMIYNIFNISIAERLKYFGLLRSIGITEFQIKSLVFGEAIILGVIFIPLGILAGINITELLINITGGSIGNRTLVVDSNTYNITMITIAGFLSIIAASYKPAKLASKVSPIEALSENDVIEDDIKKEGFMQKTIRICSGYTGNLAYMNIKRNRRRFFATAVSISMGVMLFISINYFIDSIDPINEVKREVGSDYIIKLKDLRENIGYSENEINHIKNIGGVKNIKKYIYVSGRVDVKVDKLTKEGIEVGEKYGLINGDKCNISVDIIGCSRREIEEFKKQLNIKDMSASKKPEALLVQNINNKRLTNIENSEEFEIVRAIRDTPNWKHIKGEFKIVGLLSHVPFRLGFYDTDLILIAEEEKVRQAFGVNGYQRITLDVNRNMDNNEIKKEINNIITAQKGNVLISYYDEVQRIKTTKSQLIAILYALFCITLAVALVNIINTISMNVITRKREFGMLRAIGMTREQLRIMIIKEGMIYGFAGSVLGSLLGVFLSFLIYKAANGNMLQNMLWEVHYGMIMVVFLISMTVTTITTLIPLRRATITNIVESIRGIE